MTIFTPERGLRNLRKTTQIVRATMENLTDEQARTARDGADGWFVIEAFCHLRDFNAIYFERARLTVAEDKPALPMYDHLALVTERDYINQTVQGALSNYLEVRQEYLTWLDQRTPDDWGRIGIHAEAGPVTLIEQLFQTLMHDIDHTEQIIRSLAES